MTGTKDTKKTSYTNNSKVQSVPKNASNGGSGGANGFKAQKVLLPTLKERQRYIVYRVIFPKLSKNSSSSSSSSNSSNINFGIVHNSIISQCNNMFGIFEGPKAGLMGAKYDSDKMSGVIRVHSDYVDKLKVCFGLIKQIDMGSSLATNTNVIVDCIYVSGMLNKAIEKMSK
jgi:RNase P/RNase MRP subunit POP5